MHCMHQEEEFKFCLDARNNETLPLDPSYLEYLSVWSPAGLPIMCFFNFVIEKDTQTWLCYNGKQPIIYLWRKVVCLYLWDPQNQDASNRILGLFRKLSRRRRGTWAWFNGVWTFGVEGLEYWMIFSLKNKLNPNWNFWRNWNVPLVLLERSWWEGLNGSYLVIFGFKMWEILIFMWFLLLKIQINSKKSDFGRKNQLKTW